MGDQIKLDYYYGNEPDKFCFYRIPKVLFTKAYFSDLSTDAKVLYGLMLDMMASSRSNRWIDKENRVYILFSIQRAMAYLDCGKDKAMKLFAELDTQKGIGLIERVDRGQGKSDLIYVKSFEIPDSAEDNARIKKLKIRQREKTFGPAGQRFVEEMPVDSIVDNFSEVVGKTDRYEKSGWSPDGEVVGKIDQSEKPTTSQPPKVVGKTDRSEKPTSRSLKYRPQEVGKTDPNNTDYNNNDYRDINPVQSCLDSRDSDDEPYGHMDYSRPIKITMESPRQQEMTRQDMKAAYTDMIRDQVDYYNLLREEQYRYQKDMIDGIINIITDIAVTEPPDGMEWVNSRPYPHAVVVSRLLKTDYEIMTHVLVKMKETTKEIHNLRAYLLTALYNAKDEISLSVQAQYNYDSRGGGWLEKGII